MLLFDIGANRGDAVFSGLEKGFNKCIFLITLVYLEGYDTINQ
jgi:hypothetical protein